jgi:hypothetical protein
MLETRKSKEGSQTKQPSYNFQEENFQMFPNKSHKYQWIHSRIQMPQHCSRL